MEQASERTCPLFVDFVRECMECVRTIPEINTMMFCLDEEGHMDCPFYRAIKKIGFVCEMALQCPMYQGLASKDFARFREYTERYCLSQNSCNCERFKIKRTGQTPPVDLLPDGSKLA